MYIGEAITAITATEIAANDKTVIRTPITNNVIENITANINIVIFIITLSINYSKITSINTS